MSVYLLRGCFDRVDQEADAGLYLGGGAHERRQRSSSLPGLTHHVGDAPWISSGPPGNREQTSRTRSQRPIPYQGLRAPEELSAVEVRHVRERTLFGRAAQH